MTQVKNFIEPRENGFWAQVGDVGRLFEFETYKGRNTYNSAVKWYDEQRKFQHPDFSLDMCVVSASNLHCLRDQIASKFPDIGIDYKFVIVEDRNCIGLLVGSILVTECNEGFNMELVTNWLTKELLPICSGVNLGCAIEFLEKSPGSKSYSPITPRPLFLSEANRKILQIVCKIE